MSEPLHRSINMSVHTSQKTTTTYRTVNVASPEPVTSTVISAAPVSPLPYALNGSYETVRYLVPVQQAVQQQSFILMQQPMMQQMVSPVYLQRVPHLSVSSQESTDLTYQQRSTLEVRHPHVGPASIRNQTGTRCLLSCRD